MTLTIDESLTAKGFTPGNLVPGRTIEEIYIHHWGLTGQTHDGVNDFFVNGPGQTSAHFTASAGRTNCLVSPEDVAWHAGTWDENLRSVGIECRPEATDEDYAQVALVVKWLRDQHGDLPLKPHRANYNTTCPGVWDLDRLDALARGTEVPAPTPAPAPAQPEIAQPGENQCRVDPGDTLSSIATQFGVSLADLIRVNGITEPDLIYPNMILDLPVAGDTGLPPWCSVDPGDSLGSIADQYGVSVDYLLEKNGWLRANPDHLEPSWRLALR